MQSAKFGDEYKYDLTSPAFHTAFEFLHREKLADMPDGWVELPRGVRASVQRYVTADARTLAFETHERFFDIQFLASGMEFIGVASRKGLTPRGPYDSENDVTFYEEPDLAGSVLLRPGDYVILSPQDAHKPRCAVGEPMDVLKIVIKVPLNP